MDGQDDTPHNAWSASSMTSQSLMQQSIDSFPQTEPTLSSIQPNMFAASTAPGFTTLQLTEAQLQQLTQQGILQALFQPTVTNNKPASTDQSQGLHQVYTLQTDMRNPQQSQFFTVPFLMGNLNQPGSGQEETVVQNTDRMISLPPGGNTVSSTLSQAPALSSLDVNASQLNQASLGLQQAGVSIGHDNTDHDGAALQHQSLFRMAEGTLDSSSLLNQANDQVVTSLGFALADDVTRSEKQLAVSFQNDHTASATYQAIPQVATEVTYTPAPTNHLTTVVENAVPDHGTGEAEPTFHLMAHAEIGRSMQQQLPPSNAHGADDNQGHTGMQAGSAAELASMLNANHLTSLPGMELVRSNPDDVDDDDEDEDVEIESHIAQDPMKAETDPPHSTSINGHVRKSERIAYLARSPSPTQRASYVPGPYSSEELWCEECMCSFDPGCEKHKLQSLFDRVVLSRAWASLPRQLQIFRLSESNGTDLGVFAKRSIPKQVQFGPFVAELTTKRESLTSNKFTLMIDRGGVEPFFLEASDENRCNWMMFVRPASSYSEQNLVAYQHGNEIYYSTIKNIEPRQELKVWYAAHYAEKQGLQIHDLSEEDLEALGEAALKWPCYECNKKFRTSAQLQKHLILHEKAERVASAAEAGDSSTEDATAQPKMQRRRLRNTNRKKRGRPSKKLKMEITGSGDEAPAFQSWKKKKTNMYLNRLKKYREPVKRSIKTLYKRTGKESGGNEWVCTHCGLTFDNPSLLNLHTLTHAAEDVCLDDLQKLTAGDIGEVDPNKMETDDVNFIKAPEPGEENEKVEVSTPLETTIQCPVCNLMFDEKKHLIQHTSVHAKSSRNPNKTYSCSTCWKAFSTAERLQKHTSSHDENSKPLQCLVCFKRLSNNSALACHMKTHSDQKYYECPICYEGFDQVHALRTHTAAHAVNGIYECPQCHKSFSDFKEIKKHMKNFHSQKQFACSHCEKVFSRMDKLKLHLLKHSNHREFICEACGKQFKRKDKLREHTKRIHMEGRNPSGVLQPAPPKVVRLNTNKFQPKVSPTDYHRFIYKCHSCLLGFKRRGMLVNHLAKRHPDITPDTVPELNLPILKTQKDYFCQYCDKVYKSSSKRKLHILKNHPGSELPASSRKKVEEENLPGYPNPTFSQTVGSVTTVPHSCQLCHKQYASKAKLLQHLRKQHVEQLTMEEMELRRKTLMEMEKPKVFTAMLPVPRTIDANEIPAVTTVTLSGNQQITDNLQAADLLTQAMSELTQSLEFRHQQQQQQQQQLSQPTGLETQQQVTQELSTQITQRPDSPVQTVTIHTVPAGSSIELSQLGQHLLQAQYHVPASPPQSTATASQSITIVDGGQEAGQQQTIAGSSNGPNTITVPLSLAHTLMNRSWAPSTSFPSFR